MSVPVTNPIDAVGAETLHRLGSAPGFNGWMFDRLEPWIGSSVLEIGAGVGNLSQFLVNRPLVALSDRDESYLRILRERFRDHDNVTCHRLELPDLDRAPDFGSFDSIVCLNVVEHIEDDVAALRNMTGMLEPGGRLIILVPAFQSLYGTLDVALGHYRRYTKDSLNDAFNRAGLETIHSEYFNMAAMPGWWLTGKMLRRELIPESSLRVFEALIPLFRLERDFPWRVGQSVIGIGEVTR